MAAADSKPKAVLRAAARVSLRRVSPYTSSFFLRRNPQDRRACSEALQSLMQFVVAPPTLAAGHFPGDRWCRAWAPRPRARCDRAESGPASALRLPQVKFVQPLRPGERATVAIESIDAPEGAAPRWRFRVTRGDALLASGDVALAGGTTA